MMSFNAVKTGVADEIRRLMEKKGESYVTVSAEIADMGGSVSAKTVENIGKGKSNYTFKNLYWVSRALGLSIGELLGFTLEDPDAEAHVDLTTLLRQSPKMNAHVKQTLKIMLVK